MRTMSRRLTFAFVFVFSALVLMPHAAMAQSGSIKVQGDWIIDVRNADGSRDSRTEFRNSLLAPGQAVLANLLAGATLGNRWQVKFSGLTCDGSECALKTADGTLTARAGRFAAVRYFVLEGELRSPSGGNIVETTALLDVCTNQGGAESCTAHSFSGKTTEPTAVAPDQMVQVRVTYTFHTLHIEGSEILTELLAGQHFGANWQLRLPNVSCGAAGECVLKVSDGNLTVAVNNGGFVLSGQIKSPGGGWFSQAWARLDICSLNGVDVISCDFKNFATVEIPNPKPILPNQIVQVKVTLNFK